MRKIIIPKDAFTKPISGIYLEPTKTLLRLSNNIAPMPEDMVTILYIKLVGKLKHRSNWQYLKRIAEEDTFWHDAYFRKYGKESNRKAIYGFFTMTNQYIFVPPQLKAKALIICYVSVDAIEVYNQQTLKTSSKQG